MTWSMTHICRRFGQMPMTAVAVPLVVGILVASYIDVPTALWWSCAALCVGASMLLHTGRGVWLALAMLPLGAALFNMDRPSDEICGRPMWMTLCFDDATLQGEGRNRASAEIVACEALPSAVGSSVFVSCDASLHFDKGDRITLYGEVVRFDDTPQWYTGLNCAGLLWLNEATSFEYLPADNDSRHARAVEKLSRLTPAGDARATMLSMAIGERGRTQPSLRDTYAQSGTAHLLAVSGLHVGMFFLLANFLLTFIPLARGGNLLRCVAATVAVWSYVTLCGSPPSAVRSAAMFSVLQLGIFTSREYGGANTLAVAVAAMLLCAPHLLFNTGFLLSVAAVAGIIFWGTPLIVSLHAHNRALKIVVDLVAIGLVATVAVLPLTSNLFGVVALAGVVVNPLVMLTANVIIVFAIAALLLPSPLADFVVRPALQCAEWQNALVGRMSEFEWSSFDYRLPTWAVIGIYALFVAVTIAAWGLERKKRPPTIKDN